MPNTINKMKNNIMPKPRTLSIPSSLVMDKKKPIKNTGIALLIAQFLLINFIIIKKFLHPNGFIGPLIK